MMKERGTFLVADVYNDDWILAEFAKMGYPEKIIEKERSIGRLQRENFAKAVKAGVKVAYGTDAGVYPHGLNARQFKYMVAGGLTPMQAIQSATVERGRAPRLGEGRRDRARPLRGPRRGGRRSPEGRHASREGLLRHEGRRGRGVAMSRRRRSPLLLALAARAFAADPAPTPLPVPAPDAGTLFRGASVYTAWDETPRKAAILVKDGKVVFVGTEAEARAAAPAAKVVDLAGAVLVPGLTDAHGHLRSPRRAPPDDRLPRPLEGGDPPARARALGLGRARATWIRGRAWDQNRWTDTRVPDGGRPRGRRAEDARRPLARGRPRDLGERRRAEGRGRHEGDDGPARRAHRAPQGRLARGRPRRQRDGARRRARSRRPAPTRPARTSSPGSRPARRPGSRASARPRARRSPTSRSSRRSRGKGSSRSASTRRSARRTSTPRSRAGPISAGRLTVRAAEDRTPTARSARAAPRSSRTTPTRRATAAST